MSRDVMTIKDALKAGEDREIMLENFIAALDEAEEELEIERAEQEAEEIEDDMDFTIDDVREDLAIVLLTYFDMLEILPDDIDIDRDSERLIALLKNMEKELKDRMGTLRLFMDLVKVANGEKVETKEKKKERKCADSIIRDFVKSL